MEERDSLLDRDEEGSIVFLMARRIHRLRAGGTETSWPLDPGDVADLLRLGEWLDGGRKGPRPLADERILDLERAIEAASEDD